MMARIPWAVIIQAAATVIAAVAAIAAWVSARHSRDAVLEIRSTREDEARHRRLARLEEIERPIDSLFEDAYVHGANQTERLRRSRPISTLILTSGESLRACQRFVVLVGKKEFEDKQLLGLAHAAETELTDLMASVAGLVRMPTWLQAAFDALDEES
jgi:hypothetical protein